MWLRRRNIGWRGTMAAGQFLLVAGILLGQAGKRWIPDLGTVAGVHLGDFFEGMALGMAAALLTVSIVLNVRSWKRKKLEGG